MLFRSRMEKELFDYSFEVLSQSSDLLDAIMRVFAEIGLYFNFDRLILVEYNRKFKEAIATIQWQKNDGKDDTDLIAKSNEVNWKHKESFFPINNITLWKTATLPLSIIMK